MSASSLTLPDDLQQFLYCETPQAWIEAALQHEAILLIDHANCEKKAAATAMNLMYRYVDKTELLQKMSQLAREELMHFEQVVSIMQSRDIEYSHLSPARYASSLRENIRTHEPAKLIDTLIVGAYVEARSCERFAKLAPSLDAELSKFYSSLLRSESRHFKDYLTLAEHYAHTDKTEELAERIDLFGQREAELICQEDGEFRFHSGPPADFIQ